MNSFQKVTTFAHPTPVNLSSEDLADMLLCGIDGDLELLRNVGGAPQFVGRFRELGYVPTNAEYLSLISTAGEIRGFTVHASADADPSLLPLNASLEIRSRAGRTAFVFVTVPTVNRRDILKYFFRTLSHDKHSYRISFAMPLPRKGWYLSAQVASRLHNDGCTIFDVNAVTVH